MRVLGVETSCDETGIAVYQKGSGIVVERIYSQVDIHARYGGVVPELASRDHVRKLAPLLEEALADASLLASALIVWYENKDRGLLDTYSETCLKRVWRAERFSWWFTTATHRFDDDPFSHKIQMAELDYLTSSTAGLTTIAENYVGVLN